MDASNWWQYGAVGGFAAVFLSLFVWVFKRLFDRFISHLDKLQGFMDVQVSVMKQLSEGQSRSETHHVAVKESIKDLSRDVASLREAVNASR